jgi:hypothetical protein
MPPTSTEEKRAQATAYKRRYRWLTEGHTESRKKFHTYMTLLHLQVPKGRVNELFTLCREHDISLRYVTYRQEVLFVLKKLRKDSDGNYEIASAAHWDVGSGEEGIARVLRDEFQTIITTLDKDPDVKADITADFTIPAKYFGWGRPDFIWGSFQFDLLDVMVPQAYEYARKGIILHIPCDYLQNKPRYRSRWLESIILSGGEVRLVSDMPIPKGRRGVRRCQWLIITKTRDNFKQYFDWPRRPVLYSGRLIFSARP